MVKRSADLRQAMLNRTRPASTQSDVVKGEGMEQAVTERRGAAFPSGESGQEQCDWLLSTRGEKGNYVLLAAEQDTTIQKPARYGSE